MINARAYTEVYWIINQMSDELKSKIPTNVIHAIKDRMDLDYKFNIYEEDDIEEIDLLDDTEKILSVLYSDYIATDDEKKIIRAKENAIEIEKYKNVEVQKLFSTNGKQKIHEFDIKHSLIEKPKEKWYEKIKKFIRKLFK